MSTLYEFMHGAAKVHCPPFLPRAQHQHSGFQLRLGGHAGALGTGVVNCSKKSKKIGRIND